MTVTFTKPETGIKDMVWVESPGFRGPVFDRHDGVVAFDRRDININKLTPWEYWRYCKEAGIRGMTAVILPAARPITQETT